MSTCSDSRTISTDTPATVVPSGESITIPAGSVVTITHRLGGNFTVTWEFGMARITGNYAAHLGEATPEWAQKKNDKKEDDSTPPSETDLWEALKTVFDPEIPVNIVDLGLVYSLDLEPLPTTSFGASGEEIINKKIDLEKENNNYPSSGYKAWMKMTLTAPGCGMGPAIAADAKERLLHVRQVREAQVDIVWDPPWNQNMISEVGKMELGLL